jgi:transcriptional regulator with XRE-family HTH domain
MVERVAVGVPAWELRHRLARALEAAGVSVDEMAAELGVHRNSVFNYTSGRRTPKRSVVRVWSLRCGVSFEWLLSGEVPTDHGGPGLSTLRYIGRPRSPLSVAM